MVLPSLMPARGSHLVGLQVGPDSVIGYAPPAGRVLHREGTDEGCMVIKGEEKCQLRQD